MLPISLETGAEIFLQWSLKPFPWQLGDRVYLRNRPGSVRIPAMRGKVIAIKVGFVQILTESGNTYFVELSAVARAD